MQWPLVTCNPWRHPLQLSVFAACSLSAKQKGLGLLTALCRGRCGAFHKTATIPPFKAVWEQCALYGPWEKCRLLPSCDVATELCAAVYQTFTAAPLMIWFACLPILCEQPQATVLLNSVLAEVNSVRWRVEMPDRIPWGRNSRCGEAEITASVVRRLSKELWEDRDSLSKPGKPEMDAVA